jgi:tripartite ATP-independent transporter DctP family solute receptor
MIDRRRFLSVCLATGVAGGAALAGCSSSKSGAASKTVRIGDTVDQSNPEITAEQYFGTRLAALTGDRYRVQVFPNSTLGDANRMNEQVRSGTLQMTKSLFGNLTAFDKRLGVLSLPYAFARQEDLFTALDGTLGNRLSSILDGVGFVVAGYFDSGSRNVYNKKHAVRTPADLKGLRIRVPQDAVAIDTFTTLGAQATPLASNEIYSALQQGVIDGAENNPIFFVTSKHDEQARYWSWTRHQFGVDALLVSKTWFTGQPKDVQDAVLRAGKEAQARERDLWTTQTDSYVRQAQGHGVTINDDVDVPAFQQAVKPVYDKNKASLGDLFQYLAVS